MTTTSPASMGGPLSESDRLAEIQARFKNRVTGHWHAVSIEFRGQTSHSVKSNVGSVLAHTGYGPIGGSSHANAEFMANAPADIEFLLNLVGVLEGQLATARALHQPKTVHGVVVCGRCLKSQSSLYGKTFEEWPCPDAVALGLDGGDPDGR